jgi:hypothetical protein
MESQPAPRPYKANWLATKWVLFCMTEAMKRPLQSRKPGTEAPLARTVQPELDTSVITGDIELLPQAEQKPLQNTARFGCQLQSFDGLPDREVVALVLDDPASSVNPFEGDAAGQMKRITGRIACERCNVVTTVSRQKSEDVGFPMRYDVAHDNPNSGGCDLRSSMLTYLDSAPAAEA